MLTLSPSHRLQGALCGAGAGALWGLVFLAPELVPGFTPLSLTLGRYLFYGLLSAALLAPRWKTVAANLKPSQGITLACLGLVGNLIYYLLLATAVRLGGIAMTSLVIGFLPVAVTLVGSREQGALPLRKLAPSLTFCLAGVVCIGGQALSHGLTGDSSALGLLCALGALVSWTWFAVANRRSLERSLSVSELDWNLLTGVSTGAWSLLLIPFAFLTEAAGHSPSDWLRLAAVSAGVALLASIVGNALWNRMSRLLPLTLVGQMILFETLFALLYGFCWKQRLPTALETLSFTLVSLSVATCLSAHRER